MGVELKVRPLEVGEIVTAVAGRLQRCGGAAESVVRRIVTDSREAGPDCLFCAIRGERLDGHEYIAAAVRAGCSMVLCQRIPAEAAGLPFCAVIADDTVAAMGRLANYYRAALPVKVVAITGSVGKTTTKEMVAAVLSARYRTHKTEGNLNNTIGLPLTVFGLMPDDEAAVLEMGMNHFGEIGQMSRCARPDVAVVTNIGTAHLEFLGSREGICRAKLEITEGLSPCGILLLNGDEPLLRTAEIPGRERVRYFSLQGSGDYNAAAIRESEDGIRFDLIAGETVIRNLFVPARGRHNAANALTAAAVGLIAGLEEAEIRQGLKNFATAAMRQNIYKSGAMLVIEDCYNANPESMRAGIDVLVSLAREKGGRPCALLGDMLELGSESPALHRAVGRYAAEAGAAQIYCYGTLAQEIAAGAAEAGLPAGQIIRGDGGAPELMAEAITAASLPGDVLLVKASRGMAAEQVLALCRQRFEKPFEQD